MESAKKGVLSSITAPQRHFTLCAMEQYGGGFVRAFGKAFVQADYENQSRLADAFPELFERYGPGSAPYQQASGEGA